MCLTIQLGSAIDVSEIYATSIFRRNRVSVDVYIGFGARDTWGEVSGGGWYPSGASNDNEVLLKTVL
jgi:hypothetical protein